MVAVAPVVGVGAKKRTVTEFDDRTTDPEAVGAEAVGTGAVGTEAGTEALVVTLAVNVDWAAANPIESNATRRMYCLISSSAIGITVAVKMILSK